MSIYFSSGAFGYRSSKKLIEQATTYNVDHIELSSGMTYSPDFLQPIREAKDPITWLVHNYFPPPKVPFVLNLASVDDEIRQQSIAMCQHAIDLCVEFGAPFYSVHSGFVLPLTPDDLGKPERQAEIARNLNINYEDAYSIFVETVRFINDYAKERGIQLLLENNVMSPLSIGSSPNQLLMTQPNEFDRFFSDINDSNCGLLMDVAHLKVSANAHQFDCVQALKQATPHIRCLHLSDNDGIYDNNQPITASSWFLSSLPDFQDVPIVIEVYNLDHHQFQAQYDIIFRHIG